MLNFFFGLFGDFVAEFYELAGGFGVGNPIAGPVA